MVNTSLKTSAQLQSLTPYYYPSPATLRNYAALLGTTNFLTWIKNSALVAVGATLVTVVVSSLAGYSLTRIRYPGRRVLATTVLVVYLVPPTLLFIPLYTVLKSFDLVNSLWALLVAYPTFTVPFCTWLLMGFFRSVPREIEERALLDGATRMQLLRLVVIPVVLPGILTAAIFAFTLSFQEYVYALTFISSVLHRTLPVGITVDMVRGDVYFWGPLMASAVLGSVPVVIVYALSLDYFVSGMTTGAVK